MAGRLILGIANPALDANGVVDAGCTITYWIAGTTTLQAIYSAEDLQTPLPNPLSGSPHPDAAGRFPMVWAPDGSDYDVKVTFSGETPIVYEHIKPDSLFSQISAIGTFNLSLTVDGGGVDLTTGVCGDDYIPFDCTITKATIQAIETGTISVSAWVAPYSNSSKPTVSDSIVAAAPVTLTAAKNNQNTTLAGWTKSISAGSAIRYNIDSNSGIKHFTLNLTCTRTA